MAGAESFICMFRQFLIAVLDLESFNYRDGLREKGSRPPFRPLRRFSMSRRSSCARIDNSFERTNSCKNE